ncbi:MAG: hypothetical protein RL748_3578 [Pseudomonadota bacterium]
MPRFAANLSLLFTELPLLQRIGAAAAAGFTAVEVQFPYSLPAQAWAQELARHQLPLVLHNLPAGDWAAGERGLACDPARRDEFRAGVAQAIEYALLLGTPRLNCLAGIAPPHLDAATARNCLLDNINWAAQQLGQHGLTLLIEAINTFDVPGFFLHHSQQVFDLIGQCPFQNVLMQYDVYHMHRMGENVVATLSQHLAHIGHIQIADAPGRHEPGSGEINFASLFALLDQAGYQNSGRSGWIGCEYQPSLSTLTSLKWMAAATI